MNAQDLDQKTLDLAVDFLVWYTALTEEGRLTEEQASVALDDFLAQYSTAT